MIINNKFYLSIIFLIFGLVFCLPSDLRAETQPKAPSPSNTPPPAQVTPNPKAGGKQQPANVLDFDADVIEGERVAPSLFVQMDIQAPNLDTLVFQRKNFNDFHVIDMKRKPRYRGR